MEPPPFHHLLHRKRRLTGILIGICIVLVCILPFNVVDAGSCGEEETIANISLVEGMCSFHSFFLSLISPFHYFGYTHCLIIFIYHFTIVIFYISFHLFCFVKWMMKPKYTRNNRKKMRRQETRTKSNKKQKRKQKKCSSERRLSSAKYVEFD